MSGVLLAGTVRPDDSVLTRMERPPHLPSTAAGDPSSAMAMQFSTYLGGSKGDAGSALTLDADGYVYVAGQTSSDDFPTHRSIQASRGSLLLGADLFVA